MQKVKQIIKYIPVILIVLIIGFVLLPFIHPIEIYDSSQGIYFEVHGTYAVAVDYDKKIIKIPEKFMFRPVTETHSSGISNKGQYIVEEIELPSTIIRIGVGSFGGFDKLRKVSGGENIKIIDGGAFRRDENLSEIPNFDNVEIIGEMAFLDCNISTLKLSNKIKEIGNNAFEGNSISTLDGDLTNVKTGIHSFRDNPFEKSVGGFIINSNGELQSYYEDKTEVVVPDDVKAIYGSFWLYGNEGEDVEVYLPDSVREITRDSFWFHGHGVVYIPASVEKIWYFDEKEQYTFYNATIVTTQGSYAEEFAKKYNIDYEIVDEIEYPEIAE